MWKAITENLPGDRGLHFKLHLNSAPATFADVLRAWSTDSQFPAWFNSLLADVPYRAFRWETPPVTSAMLSRVFEFVLLDSPKLTQRPDTRSFAEHWRTPPASGIVEFSNLSGDAILVVPTPIAPPTAYVHLAAFVRNAPAAQRDALWPAVAAAMSRRVSERPVWLNTAGAGVPWLHVRLDNRPKYYGWEPFRSDLP